MMNRRLPWTLAGSVFVIGTLTMGMALTGCSPEVEETEPVRPAAAPAPDPTPTVTPIDQLKDQLRIDDRVHLSESDAPETDEERIAILEFFDAFARGDHRTVSSMLSEIDRRELEALVESGIWEKTTSSITHIDLQTGSAAGMSLDMDMSGMPAFGHQQLSHVWEALGSADLEEIAEVLNSSEFLQQLTEGLRQVNLSEEEIREIEELVQSAEFQQQLRDAANMMHHTMEDMQWSDRCVLALFELGTEYQAQLWYFRTGRDGVEFNAAAAPRNIVDKLSGTDWIASWHRIVAQELAMASLPDDLAQPPRQIVLDEEGDDAERPGTGPAPPGTPPQPFDFEPER